jgi:hypothetical protein
MLPWKHQFKHKYLPDNNKIKVKLHLLLLDKVLKMHNKHNKEPKKQLEEQDKPS